MKHLILMALLLCGCSKHNVEQPTVKITNEGVLSMEHEWLSDFVLSNSIEFTNAVIHKSVIIYY